MTRRTALVTGANRGLGRETTRQLARQGWTVYLTARDEEHGRNAAAELAAEGLDVHFGRLDVSSDVSIQACARDLEQRNVRIDALVNNAGVYPQGSVLGASAEAWDQAIATHLTGALSLCRAFVPGMLDRGWGRVVNVSSNYGSFAEGLEGPAPYSVTKAAMNALTAKLAQEVPPGVDVKINAVCPGWVRTRMGGADAELSVEDAAEAIVGLATLSSDGPSGGFFRQGKPLGW